MLPNTYEIRLAREEDLPSLREIERSAAQLFASTEYAFLVEAEPISLDFLGKQQQEGLVWVATDHRQPVGFAVVRIVDETAYLQELDVHPAHGRRGLGRRLIKMACQWARDAGYSAMTLSTFKDIPWNAPFYERLGFRTLSEAELSPGLREVRVKEAQTGLPIDRRVCMCMTMMRVV
jgi:predicted N-acetyltransferase YhbS